MQRQYAGTVVDILGWSPQPGRFHLFAVDISHPSFVADDQPTGNQHVATWPPGREFIRHATSDTSLADPEPVRDLIETR